MDQGIIFCRTKLDCDNLERYLKFRDSKRFSCVCLHGDRAPKDRNKNLQDFKDQIAKFLICTDVAARGLDIKGVPYVINVTLPDEKANYVHRIGRVGRADRYVCFKLLHLFIYVENFQYAWREKSEKEGTHFFEEKRHY